MVGIFKKHNPEWEATCVLMADKDMTERDVLAAEFPSAELLICLFHTFRSFRREVVVDKMCITPGQRNMCLELLQQMAYATSEEIIMTSIAVSVSVLHLLWSAILISSDIPFENNGSWA